MKVSHSFISSTACLRTFFVAALIAGFSPKGKAQDYQMDTVVKHEITVEEIEDPEEADESDFTYRWLQPHGGGPDTRDLRKVSPTALNKLKGDKSFWYIDVAPDSADRKEEQNKEKAEQDKSSSRSSRSGKSSGDSGSSGGGMNALLWLLIIGGFGALVIWYLGNSNIRLFQRNRKMKDTDATEMEEMPEDIFKIPYQRELDKAIAAGNYRLAVRLLYLSLLKQLADKGRIRYRQESTNSDYLAQLYKTPLYNDFFRLTRHYEYSWYGQFPVSEQIFTTIRNEFEKLGAKI